ncbi:MAG: geranylgeranyl reductase family protein [Bacteroidales bacterium]|nr:geranylgeranyl reductase family protein [Bacteroidales bacterium]
MIAGAGPAGATCALALQGSGLNVALVDKCQFPRDKICGDSIPGPALKILRKVLPNSPKEDLLPEDTNRIRSSTLLTSSGSRIDIHWKAEAYNCRRTSFDQFLLHLVRDHTDIHVYEADKIDEVIAGDQVTLHLETSGRSLECDLVIGCDGANSIISQTLGNNQSINPESCIALRAYYKDVGSPEETNVFHLLKNIPGYFWIFPLGGGVFNVGMGLRKNVSDAKINIKEAFRSAIEENAMIREKFNHATILSAIEGFKLPMGGYRGRISGQRFMLAGDAAGLIDPLQGHGIDKAMHSGMLAAQLAVRCFRHHDFSETFISGYDDSVEKSIGKELRRNYRIMQLLYRLPWMISLLAVVTTNKKVKDLLLKGFYIS